MKYDKNANKGNFLKFPLLGIFIIFHFTLKSLKVEITVLRIEETIGRGVFCKEECYRLAKLF
jgi:hypothetical protein